MWYVDEPKLDVFPSLEDDMKFYVKKEDNVLPEKRALRIPNMERAIYGDHARARLCVPVYPFTLRRG